VGYDPDQVSYQHLLTEFSTNHDVTRYHRRRQYASGIFPIDDEQLKIVEAHFSRLVTPDNRPIITEVIPQVPFYSAEPYHQKFYLQQLPTIMIPLLGRYPDKRSLFASTTAARVNGYVAGYGSLEEFEREAECLDMPAPARESLRRLLVSRC